jgi:hypothetical protein
MTENLYVILSKIKVFNRFLFCYRECDHPYFYSYKRALTSICAALVDAGRYEGMYCNG